MALAVGQVARGDVFLVVPCKFRGKAGHFVLDQVRTVDAERLVKRLGPVSPLALGQALAVLREMFAP
jgi:mRNA interferase MazF